MRNFLTTDYLRKYFMDIPFHAMFLTCNTDKRRFPVSHGARSDEIFIAPVKKLYVVGMILILIASGCSASRHGVPLPNTMRDHVLTVAVVPLAFAPRTDFTAIMKRVEDPSAGREGEERSLNAPDDRTSMTWEQVREVARAEEWSRNDYSSQPPIFTHSWFLPLLLVELPVRSLSSHDKFDIGVAMSSESNKKIDADIKRTVALSDAQARIAEHFATVGNRLTAASFRPLAGYGPRVLGGQPEYFALGRDGVDLVLEVAVNDVGFIAGPEEDPVVSVFVHATIRAIRVVDGTEQGKDISVYISRKHPLSLWLKDDSRPIRSELAAAHASIAERSIEKLFLVRETELPFSMPRRCMLTPYSPEEPWVRSGSDSWLLATPAIESRTPVFRWEAFPREVDRITDPSAGWGPVTDVSYDLRIWKAVGNYPEVLVYDRTGMKGTAQAIRTNITEHTDSGDRRTESKVTRTVEHTLEITLEPATEYFWTVRARFQEGGRQRVTRWSYSGALLGGSALDPCTVDHIPSKNYYRFSTPQEN